MLFITDQQTLDDLNIFGKYTSKSIYELFNHTFTRGGAELLKDMFRYPLTDADIINKRSSMIQYLSYNPVFPFDTELIDVAEQYLLNKDNRDRINFSEQSIVEKLSNLIAEDTTNNFIYTGVYAFVSIINSFHKLTNHFISEGKIPYQADFEIITRLLAQPPFNELLNADDKSRLPRARIAELDIIFRFRQRETLKKLLRHIYHLDVYISVGRTAAERGFVFPKAFPAELYCLEVEGLSHPQLNNAVSNSLKLTSQNNILFLTGANMAGKSTFMKSLGTAVYLAHMGFPVAAKSMAFSVMGGIYTTINLPDNLSMGSSHFYAEVLRVKKVAQELRAGKNVFVIFDELFRGTNVKDAYEATIAITKGFAQKRNSMFVISTHIIEAGEILKKSCDNINFKYLPTYMDEHIPVYTYKLQDGITADRHGMMIINNEGIIDLLENPKKKK